MNKKLLKNGSLQYVKLQITLRTLQNNVKAMKNKEYLRLAHS